jgi:hypothetical protein
VNLEAIASSDMHIFITYVAVDMVLQILVMENIISSGWCNVMCNDGWDRYSLHY